MGSIFRSEEMTLAQLFLQSDSAYACSRELGELLNPTVSAFQRKFVHEVQRCDEMERKLQGFLGTELDKAQVERLPAENIEAPDPHFMTDLEAKFERLEGELKLVNSNRAALRRNLLDLTELHYILGKTQDFFIECDGHVSLSHHTGLLAEEHTSPSDTRLMFVTGVIAHERLPVFHVCCGERVVGNLVSKCVFILFFQGDQLRTRVKKICEGFRATLYECPETQVQRVELRVTVGNRIEDLRKVLVASNEYSVQKLREIADEIEAWLQKSSGSLLSIPSSPPAPYTIVTFPFLFAVMFGGAGHGLLMTLFAFTLLIFQKRLQGVKNEMFSMLFSGRYLLLLMGIFSIYTGLIYNDVFSKPLNIFGSSWRPYYYGASFSFAEMENMTYPENIMYCAPVGGNHSKDISCNPRPNEGDMVVCNSVWCATGGTSTKEVCTLPTEAQLKNQPYPFGLDPAPNLLIMLIYMFLKLTSASPDGVTEFSVFGTSASMANIQSYTQKVLVSVMVLCVPWMLFPSISSFNGTCLFEPFHISQNPSFVASCSMQCFQMIAILLNKLRLLTKCMHAVSRYFNPTTLNGGGECLVSHMCDAITCVSVSRGNQKKRRQATYVSIRAEECDDIGAINRDTSEGERDHDAANEKVWPACNGGLVWRWEERSGVVMEVVCLCEMGGEGNVLLLS
ncbi:hypothetical protein EMCRGX_G006005 [Ephydatia muelleri]